MTTDGDQSKAPGSELDGHPRPEAVVSRADARPPDEASSDAPNAQAQVILEDSEARLADGAAKADPDTERVA